MASWQVQPDLEMLLAQLYRETGQIDAAITIYQTLLSRDAGIDAAANALATLIADYRFQDPSQLTNARTLAERFRNSENVSYIDTLAWVYYRQGAALDAVSLLDRATHIAPLDPVERYHYGAALLAIGRRDDARHELSEAIKGLGDHAVEVAEAKRLLATT